MDRPRLYEISLFVYSKIRNSKMSENVKAGNVFWTLKDRCTGYSFAALLDAIGRAAEHLPSDCGPLHRS